MCLPTSRSALKIDECLGAQGGVQILLQGGHNPYIPFEWYLELMRYIKRHHPIHIHGFSPSEWSSSPERFGLLRSPMSSASFVKQGSTRFRVAAAKSWSMKVRKRVAPKKAYDRRMAGRAGGGAPPGYEDLGHHDVRHEGVSDADRLESLFRIRDVQTRTGGFTAFICWPLQPEGTPTMSHVPQDRFGHLPAHARPGADCPDNVPNLQSSWVTMGHKVGQVALRFGANDYGSLMMEENVVSAAGTTYRTTLAQIEHLITDAGYTPKRRRQDYSVLATP